MKISRFILSFCRRFQNQVEKKAVLLDGDQSVLQQSRFLMRSMTWGLIFTTFCGLSWLALAKTDEVVMVLGKLEPIGDVKDIQLPGGSVINKILVKSGEKVKKGQVLILLDTETSKQNLISVNDQLVSIRRLLNLKIIEKSKTQEILQNEIEVLHEKYLLQLKIIDRLKPLLTQGAISELQYLQQSQNIKELLGEISGKKKEAERQELVIAQELESINSEIAKLKAKNTEAKVLLQYKSVKTPVDGIVFDIKPTSPGLLVKSTEPTLKIIPISNLEADVFIPSDKIGFVRVGMPAEISIDSFPATDFGSLKGRVSSIGSDAISIDSSIDKNKYHFGSTIKLDHQRLILKNGRSLPLQVGMSLRANIKLRRVSYLQLLLGNFRNKSESLQRL